MEGDAKPSAAAAVDDASLSNEQEMTVPRREPPPLLRDLSPDELKALEKRLVRKVDLRLLPTMILICKCNSV